jgi:hypothetical protein
MKAASTAIMLFGAFGTCYAQTGSTPKTTGGLPDFLPSYFAPYLTFNGATALGTDHHQENGGDVYVYTTPDQRASVRIDRYACEVNVCSTLLDGSLRAEYPQVAANGEYDLISPIEIHARWSVGENEVHRYAFLMPGELLLWTVAQTGPVANDSLKSYQDGLFGAVNRARFELSEAHGELSLDRMGGAFRAYAEALLTNGQHQEAVRVLKQLTIATPQDYKAQIEFARNAEDTEAGRASAKIVLQNAESRDLLSEANNILDIRADDQPLPPISREESGLQVILNPLGPCDLQLVKDASTVYSKITGIPVQIRALPENWDWGSVDRIANQRAIQQIIVQNEGTNIDFSAWSLVQYEDELRKLSAKADPITRYRVRMFLDASADSQGQYSLVARLPAFFSTLSKYRSPDQHTVYIGVTSVNFSAGDANYLFNSSVGSPGHAAGMLSYYMMQASPSGQPYESRSRLTERIAKQLVALSLSMLGVPRPSDPRDPASSVDGVQRLDEKGLLLSQATADALAKIRQSN